MKFLGHVVKVGAEIYMWEFRGRKWGKDNTWKT